MDFTVDCQVRILPGGDGQLCIPITSRAEWGEFENDPLGFASARLDCTRVELDEYISNGGRVQCAGSVKARGRQKTVKAWTRCHATRGMNSFSEWLHDTRHAWKCHVHG